ncbi:MAG: PEGA domain-containing protein [Pseudomonadales bacterium]|jgi:hypothetical protein|nr:PEGA domain-containing protein [Pseudomonadales bacterium]MCP5320302.1 PEGA domain-containing protein [Pseudomonadales bacterium]MCP5338519.1 PEGA domain-containing protein [Pseudomonadales bacterium]
MRCPRCVLLAALATLAASGNTAEEDTASGRLRIESDPPGAEVILIGGRAGHTPVTVSERAVYPNDYRDDQAALYGLVTLRREGCATAVQRVTLEHLARGMHVTLDCDPLVTGSRPAGDATGAPAPAAAAMPETVPVRRLRQLQVLQELLDEGLISAEEELRIRRRLLAP